MEWEENMGGIWERNECDKNTMYTIIKELNYIFKDISDKDGWERY